MESVVTFLQDVVPQVCAYLKSCPFGSKAEVFILLSLSFSLCLLLSLFFFPSVENYSASVFVVFTGSSSMKWSLLYCSWASQ